MSIASPLSMRRICERTIRPIIFRSLSSSRSAASTQTSAIASPSSLHVPSGLEVGESPVQQHVYAGSAQSRDALRATDRFDQLRGLLGPIAGFDKVILVNPLPDKGAASVASPGGRRPNIGLQPSAAGVTIGRRG